MLCLKLSTKLPYSSIQVSTKTLYRVLPLYRALLKALLEALPKALPKALYKALLKALIKLP